MFWRTALLLILGLINILLFYRMIWGDNGLQAFGRLKNQHSFLVAELQTLDKENVQLSKEIRLLQSNDAYTEKMIRQRLHYVRDNEILYLFTETPLQHEGDNSHEGKN